MKVEYIEQLRKTKNFQEDKIIIDGIIKRYMINYDIGNNGVSLLANWEYDSGKWDLINIALPLDITNPIKTIEQFYKLMLLQ